jgi:hypothetical protein
LTDPTTFSRFPPRREQCLPSVVSNNYQHRNKRVIFTSTSTLFGKSMTGSSSMAK